VSGERWLRSSSLLTGILDEYFKGPGAVEKTYYGYVALYNGFTGYRKIELNQGVAHVYLKGLCTASGQDFTIADLLMLNLKQFPQVQFVKIYDQFDQTRSPQGANDSEPLCLDPSFTPSPTITPTLTSTVTPSRTPVPTNTRWPTATPPYTRLNVYFVNERRLLAGTPPFEVAATRWARSNLSFPQFILDEYFKGPGFTERYTYRWIAIYNGFTGYSKLEISNGIARVYLSGTCERGTSTYTIADALKANLKQFDFIQFVKIYDENGQTQTPDGPSDSIPACLQ
jgi:hypothetical protein